MCEWNGYITEGEVERLRRAEWNGYITKGEVRRLRREVARTRQEVERLWQVNLGLLRRIEDLTRDLADADADRLVKQARIEARPDVHWEGGTEGAHYARPGGGCCQ